LRHSGRVQDRVTVAIRDLPPVSADAATVTVRYPSSLAHLGVTEPLGWHFDHLVDLQLESPSGDSSCFDADRLRRRAALQRIHVVGLATLSGFSRTLRSGQAGWVRRSRDGASPLLLTVARNPRATERTPEPRIAQVLIAGAHVRGTPTMWMDSMDTRPGTAQVSDLKRSTWTRTNGLLIRRSGFESHGAAPPRCWHG